MTGTKFKSYQTYKFDFPLYVCTSLSSRVTVYLLQGLVVVPPRVLLVYSIILAHDVKNWTQTTLTRTLE